MNFVSDSFETTSFIGGAMSQSDKYTAAGMMSSVLTVLLIIVTIVLAMVNTKIPLPVMIILPILAILLCCSSAYSYSESNNLSKYEK
jgi:FtsH-binding integral membrane protein